ncbi:hypothetical protein SSCG_02263 [Streptomyces clavuligerus]|nr:hypothetical protein SSCG_02263 [Streptomyces clavuligerus]
MRSARGVRDVLSGYGDGRGPSPPSRGRADAYRLHLVYRPRVRAGSMPAGERPGGVHRTDVLTTPSDRSRPRGGTAGGVAAAEARCIHPTVLCILNGTGMAPGTPPAP